MKKFFVVILLLLVPCIKNADSNNYANVERKISALEPNNEAERIKAKYQDIVAKKWGEHIDGVTNRLPSIDSKKGSEADSAKKEIALTLDACGSEKGSLFDRELIEFLEMEKIVATLFVNYRWIEKNREIFLELARSDNFQIQNHGYLHRPLSIDGKSVYNLEATKNIEEVIEEIKVNEERIFELSGIKTNYFRAGGAYYDEVAIEIAKELGYEIAGFSINGDRGATLKREEIKEELKKVKSGDIIIAHFNRPHGETFEGLKDALLELRENGFSFVKLK